MMRNVIRSFVAGIAALLLMQGSAVAITYTPSSNVDEVDEELAISPGVPDTFSPDPTHHSETNFVDYYLVDVSGPVDTLSFILNGFGSDDSTLLDKADFTLQLYELDPVENFGDGSINLGAAILRGTNDGNGLFITSLLSGNYVLQVAYTSVTEVGVDGYSGRITATPLPPALLIFGTGLFGLGFLSRYRRKRQGQLGLQV